MFLGHIAYMVPYREQKIQTSAFEEINKSRNLHQLVVKELTDVLCIPLIQVLLYIRVLERFRKTTEVIYFLDIEEGGMVQPSYLFVYYLFFMTSRNYGMGFIHFKEE